MTECPTSWAARTVLAALLVATSCLPHAVATAAPALDRPFLLTQPDGTRFVARQFGDEWMNGTETVDGYTIVKNPRSGSWSYADVTPAGALVASPYVVGRDLPYALPQRVRPAVNRSSPALAGPQALAVEPAVAFTGTRQMLVILVDYADSPATTRVADWRRTFFGASNSVRHYYSTTSYGRLTISPAAETSGTANDGIVGWLRLPGRHPNFRGQIDASAQTLVSNALTAAAPSIDYAAFDTNGDGVLSELELLVIVVVAGNEASVTSVCGPSVWGHRWALPGLVRDGVQLRSYAMFGEKHCLDPADPAAAWQATLGIIVHEIGHLLGLRDLYDVDGSSEGVGAWSVMGRGSWNQLVRAGDSPSLMDAWGKYTLGWTTPTMVTGTLASQPIPDAAGSPVVFRFLTGSEYFLVENRNQTGYDAALPGRGLLIWHIDDMKTWNSEECIPGDAIIPCSTAWHPWVRLVQADNLYDLEQMTNGGDATDPFPGGTSNRTAFTNTSTPNSRLYSGAASNVNVMAISAPGPIMTATLHVGPPATAPDVSVTAASTAASAAPGQRITVNNTVTNGLLAVGSFIVRFYLSADTAFDGGDVLLGSRTVTSLAARAASTTASSLTIPSATAPGIYRILVRADATQALMESNEANNVRATAAIVIGRDLTVTVASTLASANPGQAIVVNNTVKNTGSVAVGTFTVGFYLSTDTTLNAGDVSLGTRSVTSLGVGAVNSVARTVTIPANTAMGTYHIVVRADNRLLLGEASETNNVRATQAIVVGRDLTVTVATTVAAATRGQAIVVNNTVKNNGSVAVGAFTVRFYLSTNSTFETPDVLLGARSVASLAAGASSSVAKTVTIPANTTLGTYRVLVRADAGGAVLEASETNNVRATAALHVVPPCTGAIAVGSTVTGALTTSDCRSTLSGSPNFYADRYVFSGAAGQQVALVLRSTSATTGFETYMRLFNPNGTLLTYGAGNPNARIPRSGLITLPTTGTYTVEVTSVAENSVGPYSLLLTTNPDASAGIASSGPADEPAGIGTQR